MADIASSINAAPCTLFIVTFIAVINFGYAHVIVSISIKTAAEATSGPKAPL